VLARTPAGGYWVVVAAGTLEVHRMDGRRVDRVRFTPTPMPHEAATEGGEGR
jgi:CBS domain containing-hemolysin-like protein